MEPKRAWKNPTPTNDHWPRGVWWTVIGRHEHHWLSSWGCTYSKTTLCCARLSWRRSNSRVTVLPFQGIEQRKKRVAQWVVICPWRSPVCGVVCRLGRNGPLKDCEKQFNLDHHQCEDYRGTRVYNEDSALVIKRWLNRVEEDASGLTF